ncbi:hypothetical protein SAMN05216302_1002149 [Nitrosomonas aestuarii]|uniref:Uncharacterized protein n=1 Tax=Nitrosomonas aestuarii TaxID=52441 RepID=A0A1I3XZU6_9PROT|nr:hypothetical protein [Nitrosomonas aestuarii]SFK24739.1 hypothetical protein SAMN05216302_1002149 [Nitrosomonas aestuarii]
MPAIEQINRIRSDPDALDFETLRKDAIALIQNLCGECWTDYNLHDPGVTILEQLCYALTDLSYRAEFSIQDFLVNSGGVVDYEKQTLYPPHEILPSSAVTHTDYERVVYDGIPEIDQIRFKPYVDEQSEVTGLYTVYVKIDRSLFQIRTDAIYSEKVKNETERINRLRDSLSYLHSVTSQIVESLQLRQNALKRWRDRIDRSEHETQAKQMQRIESSIHQSEEILSLLTQHALSLSHAGDALNAIDAMQHGQSCQTKTIVQSSEQLAALEQLLNHLPVAKLEQIHAILDTPLQKLSDIIPVLNNILPRLTALFNEITVPLAKKIDCLKTDKTHLPLSDETRVKQRILAVFSSNRSLGEDIHSIKMIESSPFFLVGDIEVHPHHNPAKVYAEIMFRCSRFISSDMQIDHYGSVLAENKNYEQVFSGPLTQHGYIRNASADTSRGAITIMDLIAYIGNIKGVTQTRNLALTDKDGRQYVSLNYLQSQHFFPDLRISYVENSTHILHLRLPQSADEVETEIVYAEAVSSEKNEPRKNAVFFEEFHRELKKLIFEYHAFRRNTQSLTQFIPLPNGQLRDFRRYYSIQNHFPAIYGVNKQGMSRAKPPEALAKVKQLKAYLYPFEQLMANYLQGLQEIPGLFSAYQESRKTYFSQFLDNTKIPGIEALYTEIPVSKPSAIGDTIDDIPGRYDEYGVRKNRILDILLALYGEVFEQHKLLRFNYYRHKDADDWMIENKINYLKSIRKISKDKGKGFDYLQPVFASQHLNQKGNLAGLHIKVRALLGLKHVLKPVLTTDVLTEKQSRLISDRALASKIKWLSGDSQHEAVPVISDFKPGKWTENTLPTRLPVFSDSIFKEGIKLDNYRLVRSAQKDTMICFMHAPDNKLWILAKEATFDKAALYAHQFCNTLSQLNQLCEDFHIIEHLLLRPRGPKENDVLASDHLFINNRISILFPSWTTRFSDNAFRKFAEETIQRNLPAHVFAQFYWLDFSPMQRFEKYYKDWLYLMQQLNQAQDHEAVLFPQLNQVSAQIISFLNQYRQEGGRDYWL